MTDGRYEMRPSPEWIEVSEIRTTGSLIEFFGFDETTDLDLQLLNVDSSGRFIFAVGNCLSAERVRLDSSLFIELAEGTTMKVTMMRMAMAMMIMMMIIIMEAAADRFIDLSIDSFVDSIIHSL